jgi:hypothetical protein
MAKAVFAVGIRLKFFSLVRNHWLERINRPLLLCGLTFTGSRIGAVKVN